MGKRNWRRIAVFSALFVLTIPLGVLCLKFGSYFLHINNFNLEVKRRNQSGALTELYYLRSFQSKFDWPLLGYLTGKTVFRGSQLREGSYVYFTGDYSEARKMLERHPDYRAHHIRGSADFRLAQAAYRAGIQKTAEGKRVLETLIENAKSEFESALRNGPGSNFDDVWNYDLLTNPQQRNRALSNQKSNIPVVILGFKKGDNGVPQPQRGDKSQPGRDLPQSKSRAGESGSPRRTP